VQVTVIHTNPYSSSSRSTQQASILPGTTGHTHGFVLADRTANTTTHPWGLTCHSMQVTPLTDEAQVKEYRTQVVPDVYALGDCCANTSNPLPALAQVKAGAARGRQGRATCCM
jgi:hypothetical protein